MGAIAAGAFGLAWIGRNEQRNQEARRRQEEEARRLLFARAGSPDGEPDGPKPWDDPTWDEKAWDDPAGRPWRPTGAPERGNDEPWQVCIDRLCERLFNRPEEDAHVLSPERESRSLPTASDVPGSAAALALATSRVVPGRGSQPERRWLSSLPSPRLRGEGPGVRGCLTALPRQDSAKPSDARPAPGPTNAKPRARSSNRLRAFFPAACLVLGCLFLVKAAPSDWSSSHSPRPVAVSAERSQPQYITSNIEDLRVGDWVLARNPEITDEQRQQADEERFDPAEWRTIALRMTKPDGGRLDITLLRPLEWLEQYQAKPGSTIHLDLEELGAVGPAEVVSIDPCPDIGPAPSADCRLVTGTFAHESAQVLDLTIEGLDEPIGVTANHPFWSEDRQAFVPAGQLRIGEHLGTAARGLLSAESESAASAAPRALVGAERPAATAGTTRSGRTAAYPRVLSIRSRPGLQAVYNLEIDLEHVYYVSTSALLVHNSYPGPKRVKVDYKKSPESAEHLLASGSTGRALRVNRSGAKANRASALKGKARMAGYDLDEAPPAVLRQPGDSVSVRPVPRGDNRSAGAQIGGQLRDVPDGGEVIIDIVNLP